MGEVMSWGRGARALACLGAVKSIIGEAPGFLVPVAENAAM